MSADAVGYLAGNGLDPGTATFTPNLDTQNFFDGSTPIYWYTPMNAWSSEWEGSNQIYGLPETWLSERHTQQPFTIRGRSILFHSTTGTSAMAWVYVSAGNSTPVHNSTVTLEIDGEVVNTQQILPTGQEVLLSTLVPVARGAHTATVTFNADSSDYDPVNNPYTLGFNGMMFNNSLQIQAYVAPVTV
jgi:hypothetical protein